MTSTLVPIIITAGYDGLVRAWDTDSGNIFPSCILTLLGELIRTFSGHEEEVFTLAVTQRTIKPVLLSAGMDQSIKCWKLPLSLFHSITTSRQDDDDDVINPSAATAETIFTSDNLRYNERIDQRELDQEEEKQIEEILKQKEKIRSSRVEYVEEEDDELDREDHPANSSAASLI